LVDIIVIDIFIFQSL